MKHSEEHFKEDREQPFGLLNNYYIGRKTQDLRMPRAFEKTNTILLDQKVNEEQIEPFIHMMYELIGEENMIPFEQEIGIGKERYVNIISPEIDVIQIFKDIRQGTRYGYYGAVYQTQDCFFSVEITSKNNKPWIRVCSD